ncbi:MAG: HlyD family efflux transporter periplasmic adaptor subunit [Planctomycetaceae bacterium]|nr:HlyD family efflux transporter periplasmic adaptor subunit [Planctomycetaceae bacterium]
MRLGLTISRRWGFVGGAVLLASAWWATGILNAPALLGQERTLPRLPIAGGNSNNGTTTPQTLPAIPNRLNPSVPSTGELSSAVQDTAGTSGFPSGSAIQPISNPQPNRNAPVAGMAVNNGRLRLGSSVVKVIEKAELPAREAGVLNQLHVREGQNVEAGAVIAMIDDSQAAVDLVIAQQRMEASQLKVNSDIAIRYAEASERTARKAYQRQVELAKTSSGIESKKDEAYLAAIQSELQVEKAKHDYQVDQKTKLLDETQVQKAQQLMERYAIIAPWNGVVAKTIKRQSEWVNAGDPILELIQMDRVWIEGSIDPKIVHPFQVSAKTAEVVLTLTNGEKIEFQGRINFVGTEVVGNSYKVRAEVINRQHEDHWLLIPGMFVEMDVLLQEPSNDRVSQQQ